MSTVQEIEPIIKTEWRFLNKEQIKEFQEIVRVLNNYYSAFSTSKTGVKSFRERFISTSVEKVKSVAIKHFGEYEYFISVKITDDDKDQWIHIDGIAEERKLFKDKKGHPIFSITCLEDLYLKAEDIYDYSF